MPPGAAPDEQEWCERRLLARIHRLTVATLRKQIEPVTPAQFMRWLLYWQHVTPGTQVERAVETIEEPDDFQARATKEGKAAQALAEELLTNTGFEIVAKNHRLRGTGVTINFISLAVSRPRRASNQSPLPWTRSRWNLGPAGLVGVTAFITISR